MIYLKQIIGISNNVDCLATIGILKFGCQICGVFSCNQNVIKLQPNQAKVSSPKPVPTYNSESTNDIFTQAVNFV